MRGTFKSLLLAVALIMPAALRAAEPWQPIPRRLPPQGIAISEADRRELGGELERLQQRRDDLRKGGLPGDLELLAVDVDIYLKAVRFALEESEFYRDSDVAQARGLLKTAAGRLDELSSGRHAWSEDRGLVVRGYRSRIDDSAQPYGLEIPEKLDLTRPVPLFVWLHGRNDKLTDLQFIAERGRQPGRIHADNAIVLHPFGRSCLGWKSTAEVDVLEAIESVSRRYPIDPERVVLMGFSMGGAGAWHIGAHYADRFAAVHAGAGFVDVARYQKLSPDDYPPPYEQKLWGLYDVPDYVRNLFNLPVVAYSGEVDKQKDAADFMAEAFHKQGQELVHLIGPGMAHKYDPEILKQVMARMQDAAAKGRDAKSSNVSLQTRTLRYNRMRWVEALALREHWRDARIDARHVPDDRLEVRTKNIQSLRLDPPRPVASLAIDGQQVEAGTPPLAYEMQDGRWVVTRQESAESLRKRHGLQGPIDDVLMEPFVLVLPSGSASDNVQRWVEFELDHFRRRWKNVYRAELRVVRDVDVTPEVWRNFNLIAFGDPASNALIKRVQDRLPVTWSADKLALGPRAFDRNRHVPLLIYPNPLNPAKYLVLNSGPTHREAHDRTNALQNPQLGDWAIVDVTVPPDAERPGRVVAAGFFDESWQLPAGDGVKEKNKAPGE
jgi:pimeloyl-ACP methyl ester carboxylesterase